MIKFTALQHCFNRKKRLTSWEWQANKVQCKHHGKRRFEMIPVCYVVTCPNGTWNRDTQLEQAQSVFNGFNAQRQHRPPIYQNHSPLIKITTKCAFKQGRFWATHVNQKWAFFSFNVSWRYQICIASVFTLSEKICPNKCLKSPHREQNSDSGVRASLKNAAA